MKIQMMEPELIQFLEALAIRTMERTATRLELMDYLKIIRINKTMLRYVYVFDRWITKSSSRHKEEQSVYKLNKELFILSVDLTLRNSTSILLEMNRSIKILYSIILQSLLLIVACKVTMEPYSLMVKQVQVKHSPFKVQYSKLRLMNMSNAA